MISLKKGATVNSASYCQLLKQNSPYLLNDSYREREREFFGTADMKNYFKQGESYFNRQLKYN